MTRSRSKGAQRSISLYATCLDCRSTWTCCCRITRCPENKLSRAISHELRDSSARLQKLGFTVNVASAAQGADTKLSARRDNIEIKVEVNVVLRGVVGTVANRTLARRAQEILQAEIEVPVASLE